MSRETVQSVTLWADEMFGPVTIARQIRRALAEMRELEDILDFDKRVSSEKVAEEAADVVICLYRLIGHLDPEAIDKKMKKNRQRKWDLDGFGCAQHIEES